MKRHGVATAVVLCLLFGGSSVLAGVQNLIVEEAPAAKFTGTWYEIGRGIGRTYPEYIIEFGRTMKTVLLFAGPGNGWTPEVYYEQTGDLIPQSVKDHMQGLAMGLCESSILSYGAAWDLVLTQNMAIELLNMSTNMESIPEVVGCTGFAVSSPAGNFLCHNTDSQSGSGDNIVVIMYWEPTNGDYAYMTIDPPGWADVGFGRNEMGVAITTNAGRPNTGRPAVGLYSTFMQRYVMEHAATLDEAVEYFETHLAEGNSFGTSGALIHIMDFKDGSMAKLQLRSEALEVTYGSESPSGATYIGSSNYFVGDFSPDQDYYNESCFKRYERLMELIEQTAVFDLDACWRILSDTDGGEAGNNTISRAGDTSATTFGHIFTEDGISYTMGPPHLYLDAFDSPARVGFDDIATSNLAHFRASPGCRRITITWDIESESDIQGYNLYRTDTQNGTYQKINDSLILEKTCTDRRLTNGKRYYYKLETVNADGTSGMYGIVSATPRLVYLLRQPYAIPCAF